MTEGLNDTVRVSRRTRDDWEEITPLPARVVDASMWIDLSLEPGDVVTTLEGKRYEVVGTAPVDDRPVRRVFLRRLYLWGQHNDNS